MIVIATGMHRSGTSALAGLLHTNGIVMGENEHFKPRPKKQNVKGFFENFRFRSLNDKILEYNDYRVKSFSPIIPIINFTNEHVDEGRQLIKEYSNKYENWGWKDPRTCLTLNFWLPLCTNVYVVISRRSYKAIGYSMTTRNKGGGLNQYLDLCIAYYRMLYLNIGNVKWTNIFFERLCSSTSQEANVLSKFLNYPINNLSFINTKLQHHGGANV